MDSILDGKRGKKGRGRVVDSHLWSEFPNRVSQRCRLIRIGPLGLLQQLNELLFPRQQPASNEAGIPWPKTPNQTNQYKDYSEF